MVPGLKVKHAAHPRAPTPNFNNPLRSKNKNIDQIQRNLPPIYKLRKYFLAEEVAAHNNADDCWVTLFH